MVMLPTNQKTTSNKLDEGIAESSVGRGYMGLSGIGNPCQRSLQYQFHMATNNEIGHRLSRIFETGNIAENFMIADLKRIGISVWGEQDEIIGFAGHWKGHIDGRCLGVIEAPKTPHLLEMKTHNQKSFDSLLQKGVEASKPTHYAQMQIYMDGIGYTRALYMAYNKNTSHYYAERVRIDKELIEKLKEKQRVVLIEETPFLRIGTNKPSWYECKFCNDKEICFGKVKPLQNCGTCHHRDVYKDGVFKCGLDDAPLIWERQVKGCGQWRINSKFFQ